MRTGNNTLCRLDKACLRAPSKDTSTERKRYVEIFISVEVHAMLLPETGMYSPQAVSKDHSWGTAVCRKA